jgi:adenylate cyclase
LTYGILGVKTSLRLYSRLILFVFVTGHFFNHGLGLFSFDAMVARTEYLFRPMTHHHWLNAIYGGLFSSYNASTDLFVATAQFAHVRMVSNTNLFGVNGTVHSCCPYFWHAVPWRGIIQFTASIFIWTYACIGLHPWLRIYPSYAKVLNTALAFAVFLPTFPLLAMLQRVTVSLNWLNKKDGVHSCLQKQGLSLG